tara:strand:- start:2357 stop:2530 length:174 start_codon:yes stop_codon:yes gene_type:complete
LIPDRKTENIQLAEMQKLVGYLSDSFVSKRRRRPLRVSSVEFGDEPGGEPELEPEPE